MDPCLHGRPRRLARPRPANDLAELPRDRIADVMGRYYAMDRDKRWERTERALAADRPTAWRHSRRRSGRGRCGASYDAGVTDEFVEPIVVSGRRLRLAPGTRVDLLQFPARPSAAASDQAARARRRPDHDDAVSRRLPCAGGVRASRRCGDTLAEVLSAHGLRQLHAAETEKYAHVTYFFNGGREEEWEGEERMLVPSPRDVPSYDLKPEMSAAEVADRFAGEIGAGFAFGVVNFANPDMVGHTGSIPAVDPRRRDRGRLSRARSSRRSTRPAASASSPPTTATPR